MFPRFILAGLLSAVFLGAPGVLYAQTSAAAPEVALASPSGTAPDVLTESSSAPAAPAPAPRQAPVAEDFTLSAPMADSSVPVIVAPGAAPVQPQGAPSAPLTEPEQPRTFTTQPAQTAPAAPAEPAAAPASPEAAAQTTSPATPASPASAASLPAPETTSSPAPGAAPGTSASDPLMTDAADPLSALLSQGEAGIKIAFLLPEADSPLAGPAEDILQGVLAANYASEAPLEVLRVRPAAGESAASQLKRAAMAGAMAAIGPLERDKVAELARLEYLPLPVVTLNQIDMDRAVPLTEEEIAVKRSELAAKRASEQHLRELIIAETNEALGETASEAQAARKSSGSIKTRSTVPGLVFAEELEVEGVRYEPLAFPHNLLMLGLSMEDDAARVARLGLAALPPATSRGERPKVLLLDHDTPLEKRVSGAFERTLVAAGFAPDRLTVDLNQFQRVSKFFDLAVERLDASEFNEALIDQEADPVGWRQQQIRIRRLKAAKRARAALAEPPYHAIFLAMDAKTASLVRSRLPMRSRIWGTPMINPGDPKSDPQAQAMTYDLLQVAFVESPLVLTFDAAEFEDIYRVPAPQSTVQKRLFALGADAFGAARTMVHGANSGTFDGLLGTIAYNLTLSPKAERRGQTAMIFGGELRVMDENEVVEYESFKSNTRRMRAQARSLERLQREAEQAARKAGTLIDEESGADDALDNYNFSGDAGFAADPAIEQQTEPEGSAPLGTPQPSPEPDVQSLPQP